MAAARLEDVSLSGVRRGELYPVPAFRSGEVYRYFDFPQDRYRDFLKAESRGRHFLTHIRDRFRYERLAKLRIA